MGKRGLDGLLYLVCGGFGIYLQRLQVREWLWFLGEMTLPVKVDG